MSHKFLETQ